MTLTEIHKLAADIKNQLENVSLSEMKRDAERVEEAADDVRTYAESIATEVDEAAWYVENVTARLNDIMFNLASLSVGLTEEQEQAIRRADATLRAVYLALGFKETETSLRRLGAAGWLRKAFPDLFKEEPAETQEEEGGTPFIEYDNSVPMDHPAETQEEVTA